MTGTKILFITGTDTGVGKTVLTALLLSHLRALGRRALALKPFCSGGREDAELLHALQEGDLTLDQVNPFYFCEPVAPLVAARRHRREISLEQVIRHIRSVASGKVLATNSCGETGQKYLLIEGSGGLLVPLGENYTVLDLLRRLNCDVVVVTANRLGTINHTLLTMQALRAFCPGGQRRACRVILMHSRGGDFSCRSNPRILQELLAPIPLISLPFLGRDGSSISGLKKNAKKFQKTLARLLL